MVRDPVCGMHINQEEAADSAEYEGKTYYFCSPGCRKTFLADAARYADKQ